MQIDTVPRFTDEQDDELTNKNSIDGSYFLTSSCFKNKIKTKHSSL